MSNKSNSNKGERESCLCISPGLLSHMCDKFIRRRTADIFVYKHLPIFSPLYPLYLDRDKTQCITEDLLAYDFATPGNLESRRRS
jgi:hypothetical protein